MLWIATTLTSNEHLRHSVFPASPSPHKGSVNARGQPCFLPTHVCPPPALRPMRCPNLPYQPITLCLDKGQGHGPTSLLPRSSS